jgi:hypothetical protein
VRVGGLFAPRTYVQFEGEALAEIDDIVTCQPHPPRKWASGCRFPSAVVIAQPRLDFPSSLGLLSGSTLFKSWNQTPADASVLRSYTGHGVGKVIDQIERTGVLL